jgi:hypothetical protein
MGVHPATTIERILQMSLPPPPEQPSGQPPWEQQRPQQYPGQPPPYQQRPQSGQGEPPFQRYQPPPRTPRRKHTGRNIALLAAAAVLVLIVAAIAGAASHKKSPAAATASGAGASASPSPTPLTAAEQKFVSDIRGGLGQPGYNYQGNDASIVSLGQQICSARQDGDSQATVLAGLGEVQTKLQLSPSGVEEAAERDLCGSYLPKPPPKPRVLLRFSGNGIANSRPILVTQGNLVASYSFSCASFGQQGNFAADFEYGNQASMNSDDQPIANSLAMSGHSVTHIYPEDPGQMYYVSVDSECDWSVVISTP